MASHIKPIDVPGSSDIKKHVQGADFFDSYEMPHKHHGRSALEIYLDVISKTPRWVNFLMSTRNRVVSLLGLKNLGRLDALTPAKKAAAYRIGHRIGIFSLLSASDNEIILGNSDKHLDARVSICKISTGIDESIAVSTVVHIHNLLGHVYMFFVVPVHRLIVPAVLSKASDRRSKEKATIEDGIR